MLQKSLETSVGRGMILRSERFDRDGNPIQLKFTKNEDRILFEVSYTLNLLFAKASRIQEVEERFKNYLSIIQAILRKENHEIQGKGIHPFWAEMIIVQLSYPRYEMLMQYLAIGKNMDDLHNYPEYGAFICGESRCS